MELIHGGDVAGYELAHGRSPLDFSANLNPFGLPPGVARAARLAVDGAAAYPDPLCRKLRNALADHLGVGAERIVCGNGAADMIFRLMLAVKPAKALLTAPTFAEYENALRCAGAEIMFHALARERGFSPGDDLLDALRPDLDIVCLCQPNNPTGLLIDRDLLLEILRRCERNRTLLLVDECFVPFVDNPEKASLLPLAPEHPGLAILGSFTKLYAMAGLRLGFAVCSDPLLVDALYRAGQPWSVSSVAQAAGCAALSETAYVTESLAALRREREWLRGEFAGMGIRCAGEANYLFFHCDCPGLRDALAGEGILIRDCGNFRGLGRGDYRVAVRLREDNERLILAMRQITSARISGT